MSLFDRLRAMNGGDLSLTRSAQDRNLHPDPRDVLLTAAEARTVRDLDRQAHRFDRRMEHMAGKGIASGQLVFRGGRRAAKAARNAADLREQAEAIRRRARDRREEA